MMQHSYYVLWYHGLVFVKSANWCQSSQKKQNMFGNDFATMNFINLQVFLILP